MSIFQVSLTTPLSSAIHALFSFWQSAFLKDTCVPWRLLKLGIHIQILFIVFLNSWTTPSSVSFTDYFWVVSQSLKLVALDTQTRQTFNCSKFEIPVYDQVNSFEKIIETNLCEDKGNSIFLTLWKIWRISSDIVRILKSACEGISGAWLLFSFFSPFPIAMTAPLSGPLKTKQQDSLCKEVLPLTRGGPRFV